MGGDKGQRIQKVELDPKWITTWMSLTSFEETVRVAIAWYVVLRLKFLFELRCSVDAEPK